MARITINETSLEIREVNLGGYIQDFYQWKEALGMDLVPVELSDVDISTKPITQANDDTVFYSEDSKRNQYRKWRIKGYGIGGKQLVIPAWEYGLGRVNNNGEFIFKDPSGIEKNIHWSLYPKYKYTLLYSSFNTYEGGAPGDITWVNDRVFIYNDFYFYLPENAKLFLVQRIGARALVDLKNPRRDSGFGTNPCWEYGQFKVGGGNDYVTGFSANVSWYSVGLYDQTSNNAENYRTAYSVVTPSLFYQEVTSNGLGSSVALTEEYGSSDQYFGSVFSFRRNSYTYTYGNVQTQWKFAKSSGANGFFGKVDIAANNKLAKIAINYPTLTILRETYNASNNAINVLASNKWGARNRFDNPQNIRVAFEYKWTIRAKAGIFNPNFCDWEMISGTINSQYGDLAGKHPIFFTFTKWTSLVDNWGISSNWWTDESLPEYVYAKVHRATATTWDGINTPTSFNGATLNEESKTHSFTMIDMILYGSTSQQEYKPEEDWMAYFKNDNVRYNISSIRYWTYLTNTQMMAYALVIWYPDGIQN